MLNRGSFTDVYLIEFYPFALPGTTRIRYQVLNTGSQIPGVKYRESNTRPPLGGNRNLQTNFGKCLYCLVVMVVPSIVLRVVDFGIKSFVP